MKRILILVALLTLPRVAAAQQAETIEYYGRDVIGSIRIVFDANGNVIGRQDFTPFGTPVQVTPPVPKEGFGGQEKDDESNQNYFHARQLQTQVGRFSGPDPIQDGVMNPQAWNRYAYALNNPVLNMDPDGLQVWNGEFNPGMCIIAGYAAEFSEGCSDAVLAQGRFGGHSGDGTDAWDPTVGLFSGGALPPPPPTVTPDPPVINPQPPPPPQPPTAPTPQSPPSPECRPGFISAAKESWSKAGMGQFEEESGFWILDRPGGPYYQQLPFTNQRAAISVPKPPGATGIFHTHPSNKDPRPSAGDVNTSNVANLDVYVGSTSGLWLHTPGAAQSQQLRSGLNWLRPCS